MDGRSIPLAILAFAVIGGLSGQAWAPRPQPSSWVTLAAASPPPEPRRDALAVSAAERRCLALNVYWESRGQSDEGQDAVAHVTLNRVGAPAFPATICGVVHQGGRDGPCQFGWYCDAKPDEPTDPAAWAEAVAAADRALAGHPDPTRGALYFHGLAERPQWARDRYARRLVIGDHVFFTVRGAEQVAEDR